MESTIAAISAAHRPLHLQSPGTTRTCCSPSAGAQAPRPAARKPPGAHPGQNRAAASAPASNKGRGRTAELRERPREAQAELPDLDRVFSNLIEGCARARSAAIRGGSPTWPERSPSGWALKPTEVQDVMLAGLLHDVGKIGLPDGSCQKPVSHMSGDGWGSGANTHRQPERPDGPGNLRQAATPSAPTTSAGTAGGYRTASRG